VRVPGGLVITPHHPVLVHGSWQFPADVPSQPPGKGAVHILIECDELYSLLLEPAGPDAASPAQAVAVNGIPVACLGHGVVDGSAGTTVLRHPFFADRARIVADLRRDADGWAQGVVRVARLLRDPATGLACGYQTM
jgi:hypothetical protein